MRCAIHSANSGSLMVIPRENKLVRLYIQLTTTEKIGEGGAKADRSKINPDVIIQAAQRIIAPYDLSYRVLDWVCSLTAVEIDSHANGNLVDRVPNRSTSLLFFFRPRTCLLGRRCGTHSQSKSWAR